MKIFRLLLLSAWCGSLAAHELWLEPQDAGYLLWQGHRHAGHAGAERVPYAPGFVRSVRCIDPGGAGIEVAVAPRYPTQLPGDCAVLDVLASSGDWTKTVHGTRNQGPEGLSGVVSSWRAFEGIRLLQRWTPALAASAGPDLALTPQHDPFALSPGDKVRLLVTWGGKPRAGVRVAYDGDPRGVSDADGRINLRIRHGGLQRISASFEQPLGGEPVARAIHATVLQFTLPEAPR